MSGETILGAILAHGEARPTDPALVVGDRVLTWRELVQAMRAAAAAMAARGAGQAERVGILAGTGADAVLAYLGAVAAGAAAVPLPVSLRPAGLAGLLADCAPRLVVADAASRAAFADVLDGAWDLAPLGPALFAGRGRDLPAWPCASEGEAPFNIIYSSGTTGRPKGIVHNHATRNGQAARRVFDLGPESRMLLSTPLYSNTTLMPMLATLFHGGALRLMPKFDAGAYLRLVQDWGATHTMLVPVQYRRVMAHPDFDTFDLRSMRVKQSTSAPFDAQLKRDVVRRFPGRLVEVYGLTEGGVSATLDATAHPEMLDTVGRAAAGAELMVIDADGNALPQGETGEVVGHSPWMMTGYWGRPDLTEAMLWRGPDGRRFFRSGDLGYLDAEGFLHLVGRLKEMINSGGFNIYPVDLESVLLSHPDVSEAAVVGIPSRKWGETPFAAVVLRPGAATDAAALLDWANQRLGRMQRIDGIALRADLPRSSIGKVAKTELAKEYEGRAAG